MDLSKILGGFSSVPTVNDEAVARAMEYRNSVMSGYKGPQVPLTPEQQEADRIASWRSAAGMSANDVRGGVAGQIASPGAVSKATEMAMGMMPFGATVFHGSPHKFSAFDMSKVGTGEGAQAYGHGLYLAENPQVAAQYKLTGPGAPPVPIAPEVRDALRQMDFLGYDTANQALGHIRSTHDWKANTDLRGVSPEAIALVDKHLSQNPRGNLYKVDLPDEQIAKMLDWDKPLSQQTEYVKKAIAPFVPTKNFTGQPMDGWTMSVSELVRGQAHSGNAEDFSQMLQAAGVPGIRYLDSGSRVGGKGTSNYVVFSDQTPKIIGRE